MSMGREEEELLVPEKIGPWLVNILESISVGPHKTWSFEEFQNEYTQSGFGDFQQFWQGEIIGELREMGFLVV